tara:strand:+ start:134 stop:385 length:252 start_codon:yes stop_codon:yes gene_type:complete
MKENKDDKKKDIVEIKKKSSELKLLIEKYQKSLKEIQGDCKHAPTVKLVSDDGVTNALRVVCRDCEKIIGYPSASDTDKFYNI